MRHPALPAHGQAPRTARLLAALALLGALLGALLTAGVAPASAAALPARSDIESLTIDDTSGKLNADRLRSLLDDVRFHEPTKVAIYARSGEYADNQNEVTLQYARSKHPEWISQDADDFGDYWADGLFIISLTVESDGHGQIGTYFGEDRAVSDSTMEKIQQAGYDDFRQARWTDGVAAVAKAGSTYLNRPWYLNPALWVVVGIVVVAALIIWGVVVAMRASRRRTFATQLQTGIQHLARVSTDLDATELAARTLPTGSTYAADLERRFDGFIQRYRTAFTEQQELEVANKKEQAKPAFVRRATDLAATATELDFTDDAIVQAAALYTRSSTWHEAWQAQTAPLVEDLQQIPEPASLGSDPAASALASFKAQALTSVEAIGSALESQSLSVDAALDQLALLRKQLTDRLDAYSKERISQFARTEQERVQMESQLRTARYDATRRSGVGSILDVTSPAALFWRMSAFNVGFASAQHHVESSRRQAAASRSSGGISHGYGGGGGSFSGSGGSSRF